MLYFIFYHVYFKMQFSYIFNSLLLSFPQIEIGTLPPPEYEGSLETQNEVEQPKEEEELPLKPQLVQQGSGGSGVLMGLDTQKGLKKGEKVFIIELLDE